jgi:hypothetical protein
MDLEVRWAPPQALFKSSENAIYEVDNLDDISDRPGVYTFARIHGTSLAPLYIGRALDLRRRIKQQLNNLRLMKAIERSQRGTRALFCAEFIGKGGQSASKAIGVIESALISTALVEGYELLNVQGTKTLVHSIKSTGNQMARSWLPENTIRLRKG